MASPQSNDPLKTTKRSYPLYDGHGNMIATLGRTATGYTVANEKKYDVWGAVRASQSPGSHVVNPNKQYCANLGHTFDGESDLIYMRARYYEPATGRFISEDPARDGHNWYAYANNNPTANVDFGGMSAEAAGFVQSALAKIVQWLDQTFGLKVPTASNIFLKISATALDIATYLKGIKSLQSQLFNLYMTAAIAQFTGNAALILTTQGALTGTKLGIGIQKMLIAISLWNLATDIHLALSEDPEGLQL